MSRTYLLILFIFLLVSCSQGEQKKEKKQVEETVNSMQEQESIQVTIIQKGKIEKVLKQEDGSLALVNEREQGFMVNENIIEFWESCKGDRTINQLADDFSQKLSLPRQQVEQEVVQLIQQLLEAELLVPPPPTTKN